MFVLTSYHNQECCELLHHAYKLSTSSRLKNVMVETSYQSQSVNYLISVAYSFFEKMQKLTMESCSIHEHDLMDNRYTHLGIDKKNQ
jgi:predicted transcriptional regulator